MKVDYNFFGEGGERLNHMVMEVPDNSLTQDIDEIGFARVDDPEDPTADFAWEYEDEDSDAVESVPTGYVWLVIFYWSGVMRAYETEERAYAEARRFIKENVAVENVDDYLNELNDSHDCDDTLYFAENLIKVERVEVWS